MLRVLRDMLGRWHDIPLTSVEMTDTFCSFIRNVTFVTCFLLPEYRAEKIVPVFIPSAVWQHRGASQTYHQPLCVCPWLCRRERRCEGLLGCLRWGWSGARRWITQQSFNPFRTKTQKYLFFRGKKLYFIIKLATQISLVSLHISNTWCFVSKTKWNMNIWPSFPV